MRKMTLLLSAGLLGLLGVAAYLELGSRNQAFAADPAPADASPGLAVYVERARQACRCLDASLRALDAALHADDTAAIDGSAQALHAAVSLHVRQA